ncbi:24140_t:CDS:2, partial [Dentiscutata erythropus]
IKLQNRDLTSCLAGVQGKLVYPNDPEYYNDLIDENTRISYTPSIYPTPPTVTSISLNYDITKIQTFFDAYNQLGSALPDDLSFSIVIGTGSAEFVGVYRGTQTDATQALSQFVSSSQPTSTTYTEESFYNSVEN